MYLTHKFKRRVNTTFIYIYIYIPLLPNTITLNSYHDGSINENEMATNRGWDS
jgi:hypothetical protein